MEKSYSELSTASFLSQKCKKHIPWPQTTPKLNLYGVKITPNSVLFENAYEGKKFCEYIEIQNCSSETMFVRFGSSTSSSLKIKSNKKEHTLCAGFKCTCKIEYTFNSLTAIPVIHFLIHVNQNTIDYEVKVSRNFAKLICNPNEINFGALNVKETMNVPVGLENIGSKNTQFALDLGQNLLGLVVFPMKGIVPAKSKIYLQLILLGEREEEYDTEIWIKCEIPQKLRVYGKFVVPKLITDNEITCNYFTLIQFSKIYYGQEDSKILIVENSGSTICMFCSEICCDGKMEYFSKSRKQHPHFKWITINPSESRLEPHQKITMHFLFKPNKNTGNLNENSINFVEFVRLRRISWKDVEYEGDVYKETDSIESINAKSMSRTSFLSGTSTHATLTYDISLGKELDYTTNDIDNYLNVCIYCEAYVANISAIPYEDYCEHLGILNTASEFKMMIQNSSSELPVNVIFRKLHHVNIEPMKLSLQPSESKDVKIFITPVLPGKVIQDIYVDLYNKGFSVGTQTFTIQFTAVSSPNATKKIVPKFNMGLTPQVINEVGTNVNDVRFNSNIEMPRNAVACLTKNKLKRVGDFLVAFPNDRPNSLQTEKLPTKSLTIFANLPRIADVKEVLPKAKPKESYYNNYIKNLSKQASRHLLPKIGLSNLCSTSKSTKVTLQKNPLPRLLKKSAPVYTQHLLSMTPLELANIEISPHIVVLRKVAPNTDVLSIITIHNKNDFNIYVRLQSLKAEICFATEGNSPVESNSTIELNIWYNTSIIGRNIVPMQVVVNNSHVFELNVIAMVVPKEVNVSQDQIDIDPNDRTSEFVKLKNPLNSPVMFSWEINSRCFEVFPNYGIIPPENNLFCHVQFYQTPKSTDSAVIILKSEGGNEKHMKVTYLSKTRNVLADTKVLDFSDTPINIPRYKTFTIKNLSSVATSFYLNNPYIIYGLTITPTQGTIPRRGIQRFTVMAHVSVPISFSRIISIHVERFRDIDIEVKCTVNFPTVDITPSFLKIKNIMPDSVTTLTFQLKNLDNIDNVVTFDFKDYPEFFVSTNGNKINYITNYLLRKKESKTFYLHCSPKEVTVFALLLPIMVNSMIGPVILNNPKSRYAEFFFAEALKKYETISSSLVLQPSPKILNTCKITTVVSMPILKVSNFNIKLKFHHLQEYKSCTSSSFEVRNVSIDKNIDFCIRTDTLSYPFTFTPSEGVQVEVNPNSLYCSLNPGEYTLFTVLFQPQLMKFGSYQNELPLYVKDFFECSPYNIITLQGNYNKPTIRSFDNKKRIYFQPSCTMIVHEHPLELELNYHSSKCMINSYCSTSELQVLFQGGRRIPIGLSMIKVLLKVIPRRTMKIEDKITFGCSCGPTKLDIFVKGYWENCIPTAYAMFSVSKHFVSTDDLTSIKTQHSGNFTLMADSVYSNSAFSELSRISLKNQNDYPFFPLNSDKSDYSNFMRQVLDTVESWLNCQGFYNSSYSVIPDDLNNFNGTIPALPKLLINFGGTEVRNYLGIYNKMNDTSFASVFTVYQKCLDLICAQGAYIPHVQTGYLLDYENYELFINSSIGETKMEREMFYRRSKQCWLDVILQIYKVFVLSHVENPPSEPKNASIVTSKLFLTNSKALKKLVLSRISENIVEHYTIGECILLKWAEMHYEKQHQVLWGPQKQKRRMFEVFDKDFTDSLCFATILYSFCPFLKDYLSDMYINAKEDVYYMYHNANKFCYIWYKLKLSFEIKPVQIVNPNIVQMVMLLNYMYEILPNFYPIETVTIDAPLSQTIEHVLLIENHDKRNVMYYVMFFGENAEYFETSQTILHVAARNPSRLLIRFVAKKMGNCTATLVLCGEVPGDKYATSMTVNLIGIVHSTEVLEINNIEKNVYQIYNEKVKLKNITPGVYDLYYTIDGKFYPFRDFDKSDIPSITNVHKTVTINGNRQGFEYIDGLLTTVNKTSMLVYGRNDEIGDFAQKIVFSGKYNRKAVEKLNEDLPENFELIKCTCSSAENSSSFCNRTRYIEIPKLNNILWKSIVNFIVSKTDDQTAPIIKSILSSSIGPKLLKGYCDFIKNISFKYLVFLENVTYSVNFPKCCGIAPKKIFFDNVYDNGTIKLPVHIDPEYDTKKPVKFRLDSNDINSHDCRFYVLTFNT